jgi:uncharacterized membrane protein
MKQGLWLILILIACTSFCDTVNQLFLKSTIDALKFTPSLNVKKIFNFIFRLITTARLWVGFSFSLVSLSIWLVVLSKTDLNFAFSADSMHYIFIALASRFVLKEKMDLRRWLGTVLIVLGIVFVSLS